MIVQDEYFLLFDFEFAQHGRSILMGYAIEWLLKIRQYIGWLPCNSMTNGLLQSVMKGK
jgi:hypothetical protein